MAADEMCGRAPHRLDVEIVLDPPHERFRECGPAPRKLVDVTPGDRVTPRVELVPNRFDGGDDDVGWEGVVDAAPKRVGRERGARVEVGNLSNRVNTRVGPARSIQLEILESGGLANRAIDLALNGSCILLDLPAAVLGARVLNREFQAHKWWMVDGGWWVVGGEQATAEPP